jgi:hypothetical protein
MLGRGDINGRARAGAQDAASGTSANRAQARSQLHGNCRFEVWYSPVCPVGQQSFIHHAPVQNCGKTRKILGQGLLSAEIDDRRDGESSFQAAKCAAI